MQALIIIEAPGKLETWSRILREQGLDMSVHATSGHINRFPDRLQPLGVVFAKGKRVDQGRQITPAARDRLLDAIDQTAPGTPIILAMDDDVEGDVICFDILELVLQSRRHRGTDLCRLRPGALTPDAIMHALNRTRPLSENTDVILDNAAQGRARAITDRWIGATFSQLSGVPVGRVRSAVLGMTLLWNEAPAYTKGLPETGEIVLQAKSASGGKPFMARVPLHGVITSRQINRLREIAQAWAGKFIPGKIRPRASLSAAVAPRFGSVLLFNTGDALAYASRNFNIAPRAAMQGLQDAYIRGHISYPRTECRDASPETAARISRVGVSIGLNGFDPLSLAERSEEIGHHEGLHPLCSLNSGEIARMKSVVRNPSTAERNREAIMDIMIAIVSRRAFEACRETPLEQGRWQPDNSSPFTPEDVEILGDLEWEREIGAGLPWGRNLLTGVRYWPAAAVMIDGLMGEDLGRPSSLANHVETAIASSDILMGLEGALPRPSPQGLSALRKTPKALWNPATARLIDRALEDDSDDAGALQSRIRFRIAAWLKKVPPEIREALLSTVSADTSGKGAELQAVTSTVTAQEVMDFPMDSIEAGPSFTSSSF